MSAIIYYGAPVLGNQTVSEELRSRGINLLRSTPYQAFPLFTLLKTTMQYQLYTQNLSSAFEAAIENRYVYAGVKTRYYEPTSLFAPLFMRTPTVIWDYGKVIEGGNLSAIKERFGALDTQAKGKPALQGTLSPLQVKSLIDDTNPMTKTPCTTTAINIEAYRIYVRLHKLADLFFRVHQYALFPVDSDTQARYFNEAFEVPMTDILTHQKTYGEGTKEYKVWNFAGKVRFNMNLGERELQNFKYTFTNASEVPDEGIIIFPFHKDLAKDDRDTVMTTIQRYFMNLLGADKKEADACFQRIRESWGNIAITPWGDELAHIYSGIRAALVTGGKVRIFTTPQNLYQGFILIGYGYECVQWGEEYTPMSNGQFVNAFMKASPHVSSLHSLLDMINFPDDMARQSAQVQISSTALLSEAFRQYGYDANKETRIKELARHLAFPSDFALPCTAKNVSDILTAMAGGYSGTFPVHPSALLERDLKRRLLSAFGAAAPSFLVAGGRNMQLDGAFEYQTTIGQGRTKKVVKTTRIFAHIVPLSQAYKDMDQVIATKTIQSPIGTPIANRASSMSLLREYSQAGGASVLASLKNLCGVSLEAGPSTGDKRGRSPTAEDPVAKKSRFDDF